MSWARCWNHASASEVFGGFRLKGPVQQFATASADSGSDKTSNAEVWLEHPNHSQTITGQQAVGTPCVVVVKGIIILLIDRASEESRVMWRQQRVNGNNGAIAEHGTTILNGGHQNNHITNGEQVEV